MNAMHIAASVFINDDERGLHADRLLANRRKYALNCRWITPFLASSGHQRPKLSSAAATSGGSLLIVTTPASASDTAIQFRRCRS